ncbi:MAG TPA: response regulator transcription factor [Terracidiphilus sp.]|nr:response regulator transcription factor [Terracidiphilus sp.]
MKRASQKSSGRKEPTSAPANALSKVRIPEIRVGLLAGEPIRMEGLRSVFEQRPKPGLAQLVPVIGTLEELLAKPDVDYLVVDLNASASRLQTLSRVRTTRPGLRLIVIGPEGNDDLVMESIIAGARAYLDGAAGPDAIRAALEVVVSGSIWAPRHLLSRLIDRLLSSPELSRPNGSVLLTEREREVLDLILLARSNREIARELGIEARTVKAHVSRLMRKTGTENRIDLSMWALRGAFPPKE